jgi:hypothetical protein
MPPGNLVAPGSRKYNGGMDNSAHDKEGRT